MQIIINYRLKNPSRRIRDLDLNLPNKAFRSKLRLPYTDTKLPLITLRNVLKICLVLTLLVRLL